MCYETLVKTSCQGSWMDSTKERKRATSTANQHLLKSILSFIKRLRSLCDHNVDEWNGYPQINYTSNACWNIVWNNLPMETLEGMELLNDIDKDRQKQAKFRWAWNNISLNIWQYFEKII
jgi:hypothetical protein